MLVTGETKEHFAAIWDGSRRGEKPLDKHAVNWRKVVMAILPKLTPCVTSNHHLQRLRNYSRPHSYRGVPKAIGYLLRRLKPD